jgi:hypothetical protein
MFIDATYEGDLLAMAGVSYHVGREANCRYDETLNGVQKVRTHNHIFPGLSIRMFPGNRNSGYCRACTATIPEGTVRVTTGCRPTVSGCA